MFKVDESWQEIINKSLNSLEDEYLEFLKEDKTYFPNIDNFLNAFKTLPINKTKYILFGQDPYPRKESAIGYAFIDAKVKNLFSENGLSKEVNRATSLRNFIKMLLVAEEKLTLDNLSQKEIAKINKSPYIDTITELKDNFEKNGVLLLNTALIFTSKEDSKRHIKSFKNFILTILNSLEKKDIKLILFGNSAKEILKYDVSKHYKSIKLPHPYNNSFISNIEAIEFFREMNLLTK